MPKATKVGKFRSAAKATSRDVRAAPLMKNKDTPKEDDGDANTSNIEGKETATLSRGQRKRLAKREQCKLCLCCNVYLNSLYDVMVSSYLSL